jgi:small subunit ribosomal protein S1
MAGPNRTRIRKPGDRNEPEHRTNAPSSADRPGVSVDRDGPVHAVRRDRPSPPPPQDPARGPLDLSGLEALVAMDPSELASMLDARPMARRLREGQRISATITRTTPNHLLLDVGLKAEAQLDREELPEARVGETIEAYVVFTDGVETTLSTRLRGETASLFLEEAREAGIPVEGLVEKRNAGGFTVKVGETRAFCPTRMIDRHPFGDLDRFVGETLSFLVLETGEKVVVSRRALQEREVEASVAERRAKLAEGQVLHGIVTGVRDFGVFVDCDGIEGLVPRSEASWERGVSLEALFAVGQQVEVRVLAVDAEAGKLTFSVKDPGDSPWAQVGVSYVRGGVYDGVVEAVEAYGAFVRLAPGVVGLLHRSAVQGALPAVGDPCAVRILSIDHEKRRIELGSPSSEAPAAVTGQQVRGSVVEVMRNGVVVALDDGRTGWLPEAEADLPAGTILAQRFRRGRPVEARVTASDDRRDRVVLTQRSSSDEESAQVWRAQRPAKDTAGFGTFGDLLGKLKKGR